MKKHKELQNCSKCNVDCLSRMITCCHVVSRRILAVFVLTQSPSTVGAFTVGFVVMIESEVLIALAVVQLLHSHWTTASGLVANRKLVSVRFRTCDPWARERLVREVALHVLFCRVHQSANIPVSK